jgi:ribonucleoside-diphosphate reductase beta chain
VKDGRVLSGDYAGVNQILPHVNQFAWDLFIKAQANNWVPTEVPMARDVEQWNGTALSDDERLLVRRCLGFFAGSESLVANNLLLSIFRHVTDPECRQYLLRQAFEESLHNQTVVYICDSLGLEVEEVYEAHTTIPSIKAKDDFLLEITSDMGRDGFRVLSYPLRGSSLEDYQGDGWATQLDRKRCQEAIASRQEVLRNLISYYIVCEGIFFFSGFAMLLNFGRQNKLNGVAEQIQYTLRDETLHIEFGTKLINTVVRQDPAVWTPEFREGTLRHVRRAVELEVQYAHDVLPRGILGLSAPMFLDYARYIANRRLDGIGLPALYEAPRNPFPWMAEAIDISKQKNFFETRVTEYSLGALDQDEEF